jgi:hypothetical protein
MNSSLFTFRMFESQYSYTFSSRYCSPVLYLTHSPTHSTIHLLFIVYSKVEPLHDITIFDFMIEWKIYFPHLLKPCQETCSIQCMIAVKNFYCMCIITHVLQALCHFAPYVGFELQLPHTPMVDVCNFLFCPLYSTRCFTIRTLRCKRLMFDTPLNRLH